VIGFQVAIALYVCIYDASVTFLCICPLMIKMLVFLPQFYICGFPSDNPQRMKRFAYGRTRFMITSMTSYFTRIAVGDCRDGILFYSYHEVSGEASFCSVIFV
jgi:hypothetical protein